MKPIKFLGVMVGLASLVVLLAISFHLFNSFPLEEDITPVLKASSRSTPPDIIHSDYEYVPFETMIKEADVIMAGKVIVISETKWNQDSGKYWEETFEDSVGETIVSALPYYEITVSVDQLLADSLEITEDKLIITVMGASPIDHQDQLSSIHPKGGDEIVVFVRQGEISWRSGPVTYNKADGSFETGRKAALLLLGGPDNSHLLQNENGLYYRPSAKDSPVEEQINPISLEDLTKSVQDKRVQ